MTPGKGVHAVRDKYRPSRQIHGSLQKTVGVAGQTLAMESCPVSQVVLLGKAFADAQEERQEKHTEEEPARYRYCKSLATGLKAEVLPSNEPFSITLVVNATASLKGVQIAIRITNEQGIPILTTTNCDQAGKLQEISRGRYRYTVSLPASFLPPGYYTLIVASFVPGEKLFDVVEDKLGFCIDDMGSLATLMKDGRLGVVTPLMPWDEVRL